VGVVSGVPRYFAVKAVGAWRVWDRVSKERVQDYPETLKGQKEAEEHAARLQAQVNARHSGGTDE